MNYLRSVISICVQDLRKWKTDYRIWVIGIMAIIMTQVYIDDMEKITSGLGTEMPVWIFPFVFSQFHMKLIYTLPVIMLFCNAPFIDGNQTFVCMRSGRIRWLLGQIMYVIIASGIYYLFLFLISFFGALAAGGEVTAEWGKTLSVIANSSVAWDFGSPFITVSTKTIIYFSPFSASWFTFLLSWLCASMIGLILFFCNIVTGTKFPGIAVASVIMVLSAFIENGANYALQNLLMPFSPISWTSLNNVDVGGLTQNPSFAYCVTVYLTAIAMLAAGILVFGRKQSIDTKGQ